MTCDSRTPFQLNSGELINNIKCAIPDNNAGLISAADVRENMENVAYSINKIVASGDTQVEFPFFKAVKASIAAGGSGMFIPESGIIFPNCPVEAEQTQIQTRPWLGPGGINHDELGDRHASNNAHTQYLSIDGTRAMTDNLPLGTSWINASGASDLSLDPKDDRGIRFNYEGDHDDILIGTSGNLIFNKDNSSVESFHGVAKAWLQFDATTDPPTINSYHNIHQLERTGQGKFKVTFTSGTFMNNYYIAMGNSNVRNSDTDAADFEINSVGTVLKEGDDGNALRTVTFYTISDDNDYVDAKVNELVCYGYEPGSTSGIPTPISLNSGPAL